MRQDATASRTAIALTTLAAAGASSGLAVGLLLLSGRELDDFFARNLLAPHERSMLLFALGAGAVAAVIVGLLTVRSPGPESNARLLRRAAIASPLLIAGFVPALFAVDVWRDRPLAFLSILAIGVLWLERLLANALTAAPQVRERAAGFVAKVPARARDLIPLTTVATASFAYALFAAVHTILRHWRFETSGFDLGIQDNLMWTAMHGEPFRSTVVLPDGTSFLSHHAELASLLFVPIYALWPGPETMLTFQAIYFAVAAIPLYAFAETLLPRWIAATVALAYLLYAPMHGPNFYDFHWLPLSIPLLFAFFWAIAANRSRVAGGLAFLLLLIREDVSIGLGAVGVFLFVTGKRPRFGAALAVVSFAWFAAVKFVVMPWAGPAPFLLLHAGLVAPGESGYGSVVRTILVNPTFVLTSLVDATKLAYVLHLFAPLAFAPLRRARYLLVLLPGILVTLLTTGYGPTIAISFQYTAHWIPYVFAASILHLVDLDPVRRVAMTLAIFVGMLVHSHQFGAVLQQRAFVGGFGPVSFDFSAEDRDRLERFRDVAKRIPSDASVAATDPEVPHLTTRRTIYTLAIDNPGADFLLVNLDHLHIGRARTFFEQATQGGGYELLADEPPYRIYRRAHR